MAELSITLGNKNYSSWSLRGWLALKQTGAAFAERVVPLDRPGIREQLLAASPSARVPVLQHGDLTVWDSLAIGEYLAERFLEATLWLAETNSGMEQVWGEADPACCTGRSAICCKPMRGKSRTHTRSRPDSITPGWGPSTRCFAIPVALATNRLPTPRL